MNIWLVFRLALVAALFFRAALSPHAASPAEGIGEVPPLALMVFGVIGVLFIAGIRRITAKVAWRYPSWRINPFHFKEPLQFFHLAAFVFLAMGGGGVVKGVLAGRAPDHAAFVWLAFGVGLWVGVRAATVFFRSNMVAK